MVEIYYPCPVFIWWEKGVMGYIETCNECGGAVKIIACIEDPAVIPKTFTPFIGASFTENTELSQKTGHRPELRFKQIKDFTTTR
ncbi:MAG: hypothetical protein COA74_02705 [Gammaproteobacteria bacterium]|nr:MAG: hypothetical protein COA74_14870 [Gammaproteobacteria bacterium]PCJ45938.1 MAG: hypothetical protein COA74_14840 [Gammaproteobacteria bacterium]PCJ50156.1 MAG: hypothetical protein COA74_02705 [Gammaproteobacteria bacterium]